MYHQPPPHTGASACTHKEPNACLQPPSQNARPQLHYSETPAAYIWVPTQWLPHAQPARSAGCAAVLVPACLPSLLRLRLRATHRTCRLLTDTTLDIHTAATWYAVRSALKREVCAALVEHVLLAVDKEHAEAQVAAPAVLCAVHLLVQREAHVLDVFLIGFIQRIDFIVQLLDVFVILIVILFSVFVAGLLLCCCCLLPILCGGCKGRRGSTRQQAGMSVTPTEATITADKEQTRGCSSQLDAAHPDDSCGTSNSCHHLATHGTLAQVADTTGKSPNSLRCAHTTEPWVLHDSNRCHTAHACPHTPTPRPTYYPHSRTVNVTPNKISTNSPASQPASHAPSSSSSKPSSSSSSPLPST